MRKSENVLSTMRKKLSVSIATYTHVSTASLLRSLKLDSVWQERNKRHRKGKRMRSST